MFIRTWFGEMIMKIEDALYIRILIWTYQRQEIGLSWGDLKKEFQLNTAQEQWVQKVFRSNMPASENLIEHLNYSDRGNEHLFVITAKGTSAAIEYLNLKEAERSSKRAEKIAKFAILIGIIVGMFQIIIDLLHW